MKLIASKSAVSIRAHYGRYVNFQRNDDRPMKNLHFGRKEIRTFHFRRPVFLYHSSLILFFLMTFAISKESREIIKSDLSLKLNSSKKLCTASDARCATFQTFSRRLVRKGVCKFDQRQIIKYDTSGKGSKYRRIL